MKKSAVILAFLLVLALPPLLSGARLAPGTGADKASPGRETLFRGVFAGTGHGDALLTAVVRGNRLQGFVTTRDFLRTRVEGALGPDGAFRFESVPGGLRVVAAGFVENGIMAGTWTLDGLSGPLYGLSAGKILPESGACNGPYAFQFFQEGRPASAPETKQIRKGVFSIERPNGEGAACGSVSQNGELLLWAKAGPHGNALIGKGFLNPKGDFSGTFFSSDGGIGSFRVKRAS